MNLSFRSPPLGPQVRCFRIEEIILYYNIKLYCIMLLYVIVLYYITYIYIHIRAAVCVCAGAGTYLLH